MRRPARATGFTLIEMIVALALFALISLAGVSLIDNVIGIQRRTDGRLERIAELQRAMYLMTADFEQLASAITRAGAVVAFSRNGAGAERRISYRLQGRGLVRSIDGIAHVLVPDVSALDWSFHIPEQGWQSVPRASDDAMPPDAVALTLRFDGRAVGPGGTLQRIVSLPEVQ